MPTSLAAEQCTAANWRGAGSGAKRTGGGCSDACRRPRRRLSVDLSHRETANLTLHQRPRGRRPATALPGWERAAGFGVAAAGAPGRRGGGRLRNGYVRLIHLTLLPPPHALPLPPHRRLEGGGRRRAAVASRSFSPPPRRKTRARRGEWPISTAMGADRIGSEA